MIKIMKPVEKKIANEVISKILRTKFKGFDLNDMKSKFNVVKDSENNLKKQRKI